MPTTRVGRRGQLTIPRAVRQTLGLVEGDQIAFVERGGEVVLQPIRQSLRDLRGSVPVDGPQDFDAVRASVQAARAARQSGDQGGDQDLSADESDAG
ncbi:MAG TPA: AbrB/MazE/SpoVT family DNA-binding domain-containing protein [Rubricoccaceae bacterium]|jgi:AbrB family looped-hinge helix DNA binding protein